MESVVVSVRLDGRLVSAIDAVGRERSEVVREALEEWLRRRRVGEMVREHETGYRRAPVAADEFDWLLESSAWPDGEPVAAPRPRKTRKKTPRG
jgi:Arc/MetJ-type ribon-helix-helix transcriptional regulator